MREVWEISQTDLECVEYQVIISYPDPQPDA